MSNVLISLDPSFTRTGICIINLESKEIYFDTASCKIGEKQFENVVHAAQNIIKQLENIFSRYDDYELIHESPLPCSSMSAALYSLDSLIYNKFESHIKTTYNPATLRSRIHQHKYSKEDSVELATKYLNNLFKSGYKILSVFGTKKKIPHDCCEAFLYSWLYLKDNNHEDFQFDNSEDVAAFKQRQKELKRRERLLMSGKQP
jgi:hypothetical protein